MLLNIFKVKCAVNDFFYKWFFFMGNGSVECPNDIFEQMKFLERR